MRSTLACLLGLCLLTSAAPVEAACCYFSALERDVKQPGQKAFLSFDPETSTETFTVQPKFEGDARDFGMVIPTPSRPRLDEMPQDFFRALAVYTILLPLPKKIWPPRDYSMMRKRKMLARGMPQSLAAMPSGARGVRVLEAGVVGSLDYKILEASQAAGLYLWLKEHGYSYAGDEATLNHYVQKGWNFTVMKIDTQQMKKGPMGKYLGEVTPTRFTFSSKSLVYPLRITQPSVADKTEAIFYVQAPEQRDLEGDWSWLWSYRTMWLTSGRVCISQKQMSSGEREELNERRQYLAKLRRSVPGFDTTKLEWAKRLDSADLSLLEDPTRYYPQMGFPDIPDSARVLSWREFEKEARQGFESEDPKAPKSSPGRSRHKTSSTLEAAQKPRRRANRGNPQSLERVLSQYSKKPGKVVAQIEAGETVYYFFADREADQEDVSKLRLLKGHLRPGQFLTKFRKVFRKSEMDRDLEILPAPEDYRTEYLRILPQSPP